MYLALVYTQWTLDVQGAREPTAGRRALDTVPLEFLHRALQRQRVTLLL